MHTIAIANHKGGVGKTTTAMMLGCLLAERGRRVLIIDMDPQANTTEGFGLEQHAPRVEDLLAVNTSTLAQDAANVGAAFRQRPDTPANGLLEVADRMWVLPTSLALADAAPALMQSGSDYQYRLRYMLLNNDQAFDVALIDTPAVGATVWAGLALLASQWVIAPVTPSDSDVRSAAKQSLFIQQFMGEANPDLRMLGVLVTMTDARWRLLADTHQALEAHGLPRIPFEVPADNRGDGLKAALRYRWPFYFRDPDCRVAEAYRRVAGHVLATIEA